MFELTGKKLMNNFTLKIFVKLYLCEALSYFVFDDISNSR